MSGGASRWMRFWEKDKVSAALPTQKLEVNWVGYNPVDRGLCRWVRGRNNQM
jgi:hypothetical protein